MKALDVKVNGLTSPQFHRLVASIQNSFSYPEETNLIIDAPGTTYELLKEKAYADVPLYKDDKSDTLYVLITEKNKDYLAIMSKGKILKTGNATNKSVYRAIVENENDNCQWLIIKNPVFKKIRSERFLAKQGSTEIDREKDIEYDNSLITKHLKTMEKEFKDTEFEHDNFLLIARRAALEEKKGNEKFFEDIHDSYKEVSYNAAQAFGYLKKIYVGKLGSEYSKELQAEHKEVTGKYAGWPWRPDSSVYKNKPYSTEKDKSGYKINIDKYVWKRAEQFKTTKDETVLHRLEVEYNKLIREIFEPSVSQFILTERWNELKDVVDGIKDLKKMLDEINAAVKSTDDTYGWNRVSREIPAIINALKKTKDIIEKIGEKDETQKS